MRAGALVMTLASFLVTLQSAAEEQSRAQRVEAAFNGLSVDTVAALSDFYAESVEFEDPLVKIQGLERLKKYYADLYAGVEEIRFEFDEHVEQGAAHMTTWTMHLKTPNLNDGETVLVKGASLLKFDAADKVIYHRDYFDMGEMVYRHIPVIGFLVRKVDRRLTKDLPEEVVRAPKRKQD